MLLALALVINATAMLLCLFVPKVYAVYCVSAADMVFTVNDTVQVSPQKQGPIEEPSSKDHETPKSTTTNVNQK